MDDLLPGVITRAEAARIRKRLALPLREYMPHVDCHLALNSLENMRARLDRAEAALREIKSLSIRSGPALDNLAEILQVAKAALGAAGERSDG